MGDTKDRVGAAGVIVAGGFFKIALYVCVAVLVIWIGKVTYQFGYNIFKDERACCRTGGCRNIRGDERF